MKRIGLGYLILALTVLALASLACSTADIPFGDLTGDDTGSATSAHGVAPASCDSPAVALGPDQVNTLHIDETAEDYPANCNYYCTEVQSGASSLTVDVRNFTEDLDLFVGLGSITSVLGVDPEDNPWKSNEYGTDPESVKISAPDAGIYYIEICSFDGTATDYDVKITVP